MILIMIYTSLSTIVDFRIGICLVVIRDSKESRVLSIMVYLLDLDSAMETRLNAFLNNLAANSIAKIPATYYFSSNILREFITGKYI